MRPEDFQELKDVVSRALELPAAEREDFVRRTCHDETLQSEALALLTHDGEAFTRVVKDRFAAAAKDVVGAEVSPPELPNYVLQEVLGSGGMGVVYRARQTGTLERDVALKLIRPGWDSKRILSRFNFERKALARMEHQNIARVLEAGTTAAGEPWFAMEFVAGDPINRWCDEHDADLVTRINLFVGVCRGVQHAHQKGIIHRDLKPSNILVTATEDGPLPKIIDFGIAKALGDAVNEGPLLTLEGQLIGTPEYMSPERIAGNDDDFDTRSDVYSLGVLLYEMLSGQLPFDRSALRRAGAQVADLHADPPRPSTRVSQIGTRTREIARRRSTDVRGLRHQLKGDLDWILLKALAPRPEHRYATVQGFLEDVERHRANQPVLAGPPTLRYRFGKFAARHRPAMAAAAVVLVILAGTTFKLNQHRMRTIAALQEAESVTAFLSETLASVRPDEMGRDVTVRAVLDHAATSLEKDLTGRDLVQARLLLTIGRAYQALGELPAAGEHLKRAVELREQRLGPAASATLRARYHLGTLYRDQGRLEQATTELEAVLDAQREIFGDRDPKTLATMVALGNTYHQYGDLVVAAATLVEAREGYLAEGGPPSESAMDAAENLGNVLSEQGDLAAAETLLTASLEMRLAEHGEEHPATISALNNLALLRYDQGRLAECDSLLTWVVELRTQKLGPDHINVLSAMVNLGSIRSILGDLTSAAAILETGLERAKPTLGPEHQVTLSLQNNLAWVYDRQGRFAPAETLYAEVLATREQVFGTDHIYTMTSVHNLGSVYAHTGRLAEAEDLLRENIERRSRVLGAQHSHTLISMSGLANVLRDQGRYADAGSLYAETYQLQCAELGADHPNALETAADYAKMYDTMADPEAAARWRARADGTAAP